MKIVLSTIYTAFFMVIISGCSTGIMIERNKVNPWTRLEPDDYDNGVKFVIVSDRTGGIKENVFRDAVGKINMLGPDFVLSVGDLITGYTDDSSTVERQWDEFDSIAGKFSAPFFYLAGNHDLTNNTMNEIWEKRFGASYYYFKYRDILFLCLNSEEVEGGGISGKQAGYFKKAIHDNMDADWIFILLHRPLWLEEAGRNGWQKIEDLVNDLDYTVVSGHKHRYRMSMRNGRQYFILGTTGGAPAREGAGCNLEHITLVSVRNGPPEFLHLTLDGMKESGFCDK